MTAARCSCRRAGRRACGWLLLLVAARSALVALLFVADIVWRDLSGWWAIFAGFMVMMIGASIRKYRFFSGANLGA
ncbi:MAG: hypothetical protein AAGF11_26750 [Myxococcota bacterium]